MKLSIIIPTANNENSLHNLLSFLNFHKNRADFEVIVVDFNSVDDTLYVAMQNNAIALQSKKESNYARINEAVSYTKADILLFLLPDAIPPNSFYFDINAAIKDGYGVASFPITFLNRIPLDFLVGFASQSKQPFCRVLEQGLVIKRNVFNELNGFNTQVEFPYWDFFEKLDRNLRFGIFKNKIVFHQFFSTLSVFQYLKNQYQNYQKFISLSK